MNDTEKLHSLKQSVNNFLSMWSAIINKQYELHRATMDHFDNGTKFFDALNSMKGLSGCERLCFVELGKHIMSASANVIEISSTRYDMLTLFKQLQKDVGTLDFPDHK